MKEYFAVNRHKFFFQMVVNALLLSACWTIYLVLTKNAPDSSTILSGYFLVGLCLPIFGQFLLMAQEGLEFRRISKVLNSAPISELTRIGFTKKLTYPRSRYFSSEITLTGSIQNYLIDVEVEKRVVRIIVGADLDLLEKSHMEELRRIFGKENVEYDVGIALIYKPSRYKNLTYEDLNAELQQLISFFQLNKITPWPLNTAN